MLRVRGRTWPSSGKAPSSWAGFACSRCSPASPLQDAPVNRRASERAELLGLGRGVAVRRGLRGLRSVTGRGAVALDHVVTGGGIDVRRLGGGLAGVDRTVLGRDLSRG